MAEAIRGVITEPMIERQAAEFIVKVVGHSTAELAARQYVLPSGRRLDLLAQHCDGERWILTVVEIKAWTTNTTALLQLLSYVDELGSAIDYESRELACVRGILCAPDHSEKVQTLVRQMPRIGLTWVEPGFVFEPAVGGIGPASKSDLWPYWNPNASKATADDFRTWAGKYRTNPPGAPRGRRTRLPGMP